jgi:hypothetical protein
VPTRYVTKSVPTSAKIPEKVWNARLFRSLAGEDQIHCMTKCAGDKDITMDIGIIGAGRVAQAFARHVLHVGHTIKISNGRRL